MSAKSPVQPWAPLAAKGGGEWAMSLAGRVRGLFRGVGLVAAMVFGLVDFLRACWPGRSPWPVRRALWSQRCARLLAWVLGLRLSQRGGAPRAGMIVSNHLSYLDILAFSALTPCVFVAKREVASWPALGLLARLAGTIFVDRTRRGQVADVNVQISKALQAGVVVVLFAEGTSTDGRSVRPFRSSLLEPAAQAPGALVPAAIRYALEDGSVPDEVCYWGDMTLLPHLLNLCTKKMVRGEVRFGTTEESDDGEAPSRKHAARMLQARVAALYGASG